MAKKTTRPNLPHETLERARRELAKGGVIVAEPAPPADENVVVAPRPRRPLFHADLRSEYAYVIDDLRNMATLAAAFMIVLVALSFII